MTNKLQKIKKIAQNYFKELDQTDFCHDFTHVERVTKLAIYIAQKEGGDKEILEIEALLHDIARPAEDRGEIQDHALESAQLAEQILTKINYPEDKIKIICNAIKKHRSKIQDKPENIEEKILQDADRLDALGAVDVARVIASTIQSKNYHAPIYIDEEYKVPSDEHKSAIHYLIHKTIQPKRRPESFHTETGRKLATERQQFMQDYIKRFIKEWRGEFE